MAHAPPAQPRCAGRESLSLKLAEANQIDDEVPSAAVSEAMAPIIYI
jgi:hypothetical protein